MENSPGDPEASTSVSDPRQRCCHKGRSFMNAIKAMMSRLVFLLHATIMLVYIISVDSLQAYIMIGLVYALLVTEALVILLVRRGQEWKWFSPSILIYLCCMIPPIWIMETRRQTGYTYSKLLAANPNITQAMLGAVPATYSFAWTWYQVQVMLVAIIVSRWLMPKGDMTRDQLSALLMLYLASASDIVDFFNVLEEIGANFLKQIHFHAMIGTWAWSMFQFPFVRTAMRTLYSVEEAEFDQLAEEDEYTKDYKQRWHQRLRRGVIWCFENETWALLITILFQDGPYLIVRLFMVFEYQAVSRSTIFFIVKNALVLILQGYRVAALSIEHTDRKEQERRRLDKEKLSSHVVKKAFRVLSKKRKRRVKDSSSLNEEPS